MARLIGPDDVREIKDRLVESMGYRGRTGDETFFYTYVNALYDFQQMLIHWIEEMDVDES